MPKNSDTPVYDALIVGARCAGAATAMLLAARGARVLVVDHDRPGTDTMSTHALMRGAVFQLKKWGLLDRVAAAGTPAIRRTSFIYGDAALDIDIKTENGVEALFAPRRTLLDATLAEAAAAAGAELRYGTGFTGLIFDDAGRAVGARLRMPSGGTEDVRARIVVGADGRRSAVARHAGAQTTRLARHSVACVYRYLDGLPNHGYRWFFAPGASGGIIPTNDGLSCVFAAVTPSALAAARKDGAADPRSLIARHLPVMAEEIAAARDAAAPVTFAGAPGRFRQSAGPGWALVGDAGYFRDPITAHGITDAFRDAELLTDAIENGRLGDYTGLRNALSEEFFALTERIAALDWSLEEVQGLHVALNRAMKANQRWIASMTGGLSRAA